MAYIDTTGTLKVLSPIRYYIQEKYSTNQDNLRLLEGHYLELIALHSQTFGEPEFPNAMDRLLPEIGNITSIFKYALEKHPSAELAEQLIR
jgi:hypothetical protein